MFVFSAPQGVFLFSLIKYTPLKYNNSYEYPPWGYMLGWLMALSSMVCIPLYAIFILLKTKGPLKQVLGLWSRACCCCSPGGSRWAPGRKYSTFLLSKARAGESCPTPECPVALGELGGSQHSSQADHQMSGLPWGVHAHHASCSMQYIDMNTVYMQ